MSQQLEQKPGFACAACGKHFAWKPELAGKAVTCKCSAKVIVPEAPGGVAKLKAAAGLNGAPNLAPAHAAAPATPGDAFRVSPARGAAQGTPSATAARDAAAAPGLAGAARSSEVPPRAPPPVPIAAAHATPHAKISAPAPPPIPRKSEAASSASLTSPAPLTSHASFAPPASTPAPPVEPVSEAEPEEDDLYALAGESDRAAKGGPDAGYPCKRCGAKLSPGSVLCIDCGTDQRTGKKIAPVIERDGPAPAAKAATARRGESGPSSAAPAVALPWGVRPRPTDDAAGRGFTTENLYFEGGKFRSFYLPLILIGVGLALSMLQAVLASKGPVVASFLLMFTLAVVVIDCVLLLVALMLSVKLFDMGFGAVGPALLKIGAIAIGPGAVGGIVHHATGGGMGGIMAGGLASMILYWVLISVLFDLDLGETLTLVTIIYLIENWVKPFILLAILFSAMSAGTPDDAADPLSGSGPGATGLFGTGGAGATDADGGDEDAEDYEDEDGLYDAESQGQTGAVPPTSGPSLLETDATEFDE